jgi:hypothetical protein
MPGPNKLGRNISSRNRQSTSVPHGRSSAGESQMAITAIDHGGRVVTVTSQLATTVSSENSPLSTAFTTSVYGEPLNASMWRARS